MPSTSAESETFTFKASKGCFEKFKNRSGIHRVTRHGEAASSNKAAAESLVKEFNAYIKEEQFPLQQANTKAWVTRQFFNAWVYKVFTPQVKEYLMAKILPTKCLLTMDNAPAHPPDLEDELVDEISFIKAKFLSLNTTVILQPMDQQVISNLTKLYTKALFQKCFEVTNDTQLILREFWKEHLSILSCVNLVDSAWSAVTYSTINSAWTKLWSECVSRRDFEGFQSESGSPVEELAVIDKILTMGKTLGLAVKKEDIDELMEGHFTELTTEELLHLQ
ncbi:tigger transposable element-derived protein 1-like [Palaemon carinicauda]|uniref:tigger transposable element-derived protein 1-like n=1 Tax=Palaemon carinicauda TaxID=392227 RepID=UPI0035B63D5D